jgi:predicted transcriptional regulator
MTETTETVALAADIVAAFVSNNSVAATELPSMIQSVYRALTEASSGAKPQEAAPPPTPAVPIKKSVTPDYIISLEDGHKYKSLKRHLSTRGMTPDDYRAKWGLPRDYPMVAASYSAQRSQLAKSLGLGQTSRTAAVAVVAEDAAVEAPRRGRRKAVA